MKEESVSFWDQVVTYNLKMILIYRLLVSFTIVSEINCSQDGDGVRMHNHVPYVFLKHILKLAFQRILKRKNIKVGSCFYVFIFMSVSNNVEVITCTSNNQ